MVFGRLLSPVATEPEERAAGVLADGPLTFPDLIEANARRFTQKVAFQEKRRREWRRMTHDDVREAAWETAGGFVAAGLQQGERVAVILENGLDWVRTYYGIVCAGGVAVPIYYDLKPSEISAMVHHADPAMAVVSPKALSKIEKDLQSLRSVIVVGDAPVHDTPSDLRRTGGPERLTLDDLIARSTPETQRAATARIVAPDDLASIVFTSGTSGGQKGVMLTHRNFMANCRQAAASIPFDDRDRLVIVLPLHHAFPFIVTMACAPSVGGEITFENDLRRIRDRMAEVKPTIFIGVPALFEVMYRNIVKGIEAQGRLENFQKGLRIVEGTKARTGINIGRIVFRELHKRLGGRLRFMISGGAALNPQVARDFANLGVMIIQGWGLSEAAPVLSAQRWHPRKFYLSNWYEDHFGSIGEAVEGVELALIDVPEKELYVHLHGQGEIIARGENITPGYWRGEEQTQAIKLGEWLRTGDIGRIDEDGQVWITGRSKFVIVLDSGEKVHPDEVEEKLERAAVVQDIAVMGRKVRGKTQIVAVVFPNRDEVLKRTADPSAEDVLELVREAIAAEERDTAQYKRVTDIRLVDEPLPRTPIRKVQRGSIQDQQRFDLQRWAASWEQVLLAEAEPESAEEGEPTAA
jgi:long-chain acyl-CoA synthetase